MGPLPFDETNRRLGISGSSYLGIREIPVARIAGSVEERHGLSRSRMASLRTAFPDGNLPAIDVFEVGGAYWVEDGHHRVALARRRGADYIDAAVTRLHTDYEIGPETDVSQLVHTEQQRLFYEESGLLRARPAAVIEFTLLDGYTQLRDVIKAHGYELARRRGALSEPEEVSGNWYDTVYLAGVEASRRSGLRELYASWRPTDADLFLWLYQLRRDLRACDAAVGFDAAAVYARSVNLGRRRKRLHLRDGRRPLPRRAA